MSQSQDPPETTEGNSGLQVGEKWGVALPGSPHSGHDGFHGPAGFIHSCCCSRVSGVRDSPVGVAQAAGHNPAGPASFGGLDLTGIVIADQVYPAARVCLKVYAEVSWGWQKGEAQDFRPTELGRADRNTTALCGRPWAGGWKAAFRTA